MELLVLIVAAILAIPFADREDHSPLKLNFLGGIGKAIGGIAKAALPFLGPVGQVASVALPAIGAFKASKQAGRDSAQSRALLNQAIQMSTEEANRAKEEYARGAPLRDAYRAVAMNFGDQTNPFSQGYMDIGKAGTIASAASKLRPYEERKKQEPTRDRRGKNTQSQFVQAAQRATDALAAARGA